MASPGMHRGETQKKVIDAVKKYHPQGWTGAEIAAVVGCSERFVRDVRLRVLNLGSNQHHNRFRRRIAKITAEQCKQEGISGLGQLRVKYMQKHIEEHGWPYDALTVREAQVLTILYKRGPSTKREIVAALGMRWHKNSLLLNDGRSIMARLVSRGAVLEHGRPMKTYTLSPSLAFARASQEAVNVE